MFVTWKWQSTQTIEARYRLHINYYQTHFHSLKTCPFFLKKKKIKWISDNTYQIDDEYNEIGFKLFNGKMIFISFHFTCKLKMILMNADQIHLIKNE